MPSFPGPLHRPLADYPKGPDHRGVGAFDAAPIHQGQRCPPLTCAYCDERTRRDGAIEAHGARVQAAERELRDARHLVVRQSCKQCDWRVEFTVRPDAPLVDVLAAIVHAHKSGSPACLATAEQYRYTVTPAPY